jgi:hypothetical protein
LATACGEATLNYSQQQCFDKEAFDESFINNTIHVLKIKREEIRQNINGYGDVAIEQNILHGCPCVRVRSMCLWKLGFRG